MTTIEQKLRQRLAQLYNAVTEANRLSEDDEHYERGFPKRYVGIDFPRGHLRRIGKALRQAREALEDGTQADTEASR